MGGLISGGAYNWMYFFVSRLMGPLLGGLITRILWYRFVSSASNVC